MTHDEAAGVLRFLHPQLVAEAKLTARVLAAAPDSHADYRPDPKSMTLLELTQHIAFTDLFFIDAASRGEIVIPRDRSFLQAFDSPTKVAAEYAARAPEALERIERLTPEQAATPMTALGMTQSAAAWLQFGLRHTIHHRGQLSVYLRPVGSKVPAIYGGSADEPRSTAAAKQS